MRPSRPWLAVCALALVVARSGWATTAADLCDPAAAACVIDGNATIENNSLLDFGPRAVIIKRGTKLDVGDGAMAMRAGSLVLEPGAALLARGLRVGPRGGDVTVETTGGIRLEASGNTQARIDASAPELGGGVTLEAGGDVEIAGALAAQATSGGTGGSIRVVSAGQLTVAPAAEIRASGGIRGIGGTVSLEAMVGMVIGAPIDASGSDGGVIALATEGPLSTAPAAHLDANAIGVAGDGGEVTLDSGGAMVIAGRIDGAASGNSLEGGAFGGTLGVTAGGSLTLSGTLDFAGAPPDGNGGDVDIRAAQDLMQNAPIVVRSAGIDGTGGVVSITAGRLLRLGVIDLNGGGLGGGGLTAFAGTELTVSGEISADAPGDGGTLELRGVTVTVQGSVHANGTEGASGGDVEIAGCGLTVASSGRLMATGSGFGSILLRASGRTLLEPGSSLTTTGVVRLEYRNPARPPERTGATIVPFPPQEVAVPTLPPCPGPAACGDLQLGADEQCDDGNFTACDGCSPTCTTESCGNTRVDCGEACDDGNQVDGDGCDAGCVRTGCGNGILTAGEACDDANQTACDDCSPSCQIERCGNGVAECDEECDEGAANGTEGAACDASCRRVPPPSCGNGGEPQQGEQCDDRNRTPCDGCGADCLLEACGNGTVECSEQCDDFNTDPCDGCGGTCRLERCRNDVLDCGEECDDGDLIDGDGCDQNCTTTRCGNGIVTPPEQCDDGNPFDADTCDNACRRRVPCETGFCTPCTVDTDCDPGGRCAGAQCAAGACIGVPPVSCDDGVTGTIDRCVLDGSGAPRCEHACAQASVCDDRDVCNGAERCQSGACVPGTPPGGFVGATCALDRIDAALASTLAGALRRGVKRKLDTFAATARTRVNAASKAADANKVPRERRMLAKAHATLRSLETYVERGMNRRKIPLVLGDQLLAGTTAASDAVGAIRAGLSR